MGNGIRFLRLPWWLRLAILSLDMSSYEGCLYVRPTRAREYDCRVDFWFKNASSHLEREFWDEVRAWLTGDWGFSAVAYPGREIAWERYYELVDLA